jgi:hypothetical protein
MPIAAVTFIPPTVNTSVPFVPMYGAGPPVCANGIPDALTVDPLNISNGLASSTRFILLPVVRYPGIASWTVIPMGEPPMYTSAVPLSAIGDSSDPATSGIPSPIIVTVEGSVSLVVTEDTSTSPAASAVYSVPTESLSIFSFR